MANYYDSIEIPMPIRTVPVPQCPECLEDMVLRRPKPGGKPFRPFWGCSQFPVCRATIQIKDNGLPDEDEFEVDI